MLHSKVMTSCHVIDARLKRLYNIAQAQIRKGNYSLAGEILQEINVMASMTHDLGKAVDADLNRIAAELSTKSGAAVKAAKDYVH